MNKELEWKYAVRPWSVLKAQLLVALRGLLYLERVVTFSRVTHIRGIGQLLPPLTVEYILIRWEGGDEVWPKKTKHSAARRRNWRAVLATALEMRGKSLK